MFKQTHGVCCVISRVCVCVCIVIEHWCKPGAADALVALRASVGGISCKCGCGGVNYK
jgi:hypothetical protein